VATDWLERLNTADPVCPLGGAQAEILYWAHQDRLPDNAPHRHAHFEVCQVGRHGSGLFHLPGGAQPLRPGTLFVARPGVVHQITNTGEPEMELFWVSFQLLPQAGRGLPAPLRALAESPVALLPDRGGRVAAAWRALRLLAPAALPDTLRHLEAALLLCVGEAFAPGEAGRGGGAVPAAARAAVRYVHDNLDGSLSAREVARQAGVSPRHLGRLMRQATGTTLGEYVLWARLQLAAHLLRRSDLAVKDVAARCGYPDVHHFTRVFSRHMGAPPAAYRRGAGPAPHVRNVQTPGGLV
jgi:AraC-like DNA-binding protein